MGRPRIGVKVDFRVPVEIEAEVISWAEEDGRPHDEMFRDTLISGVLATRRRRVRTGSYRVPAPAARAMHELAEALGD